MPKIIVSYRRSDSSATAGRIYDRLLAEFGQGSVFMDVDAIPFGTDFRSHIKDALLGSDIVLAIIGPNWLGPLADGTRRIDDEADPVRVEVETALANGITVVPVLIDGTPMLGSNQLPEPLKPLAFLNAAPVDMGRDFRLHADRLVTALEGILAAKSASASAAPSGPIPTLPNGASSPVRLTPAAAPSSSGKGTMFGLAGLAIAVMLGLGGWLVMRSPGSAPVASAGGPATPKPEPVKPVAVVELARPAVEAPAPPVPTATPPAPLAPVAPDPAPTPAAPVVAPVAPAPASPPPTPVVTPSRPPVPPRSPAHGTFAWYELWTTNAVAAQSFYRSVVGWDARTSGSGAAAYTILSAGQVPVAGLATLPASTVAQGVKPGWVGYVTVTNVDASVAEAKTLGGALYLGPAEVPGIGRYALVADPQGGYLALFKGLADPAAATAEVPPGHAGWRELQTVDPGGALAFYETLFGWTKAEPAPTDASTFAKGGTTLGTIGPKATGAAWSFAFRVDSLTALTVRVVAGGGKVLDQPREIGGGYWAVRCLDPQGAAFALMSRTR